MKKLIIISILVLSILVVGAFTNAGVITASRITTIPQVEKDTLVSAGIKDVSTTKLDCTYTDYCLFNINKPNVINKQIKIELFKEVCTDEILKDVKDEECLAVSGILLEEEPTEVIKEPIEIIRANPFEEPLLEEKIYVCHLINCQTLQKTDSELLIEKNNIVDNELKQIAKTIENNKIKAPIKVVGEDEKVIIETSIKG